jgi:hypothetical protein
VLCKGGKKGNNEALMYEKNLKYKRKKEHSNEQNDK